MKPEKIILVFKTHFDIGFTDLSSNVIDNYAKGMLEEVIETCKKTQDMGKLRYVWTMPAWPLMHIVKNCAPDLKRELDALIENGQVAWHALPFTTHTDFCSQKEYLEGFRYSRMLAEMYHKPCPVCAKMTDVPGHSIMLPDLLKQAGIRFLHLGCNEFATPPDVPDLFFWEGPGKRRVLTMYSRGGYGTGLVPPKDWKYPVWMALMHTHDNKGPQSADAIRRMAQEIREIYPDAEVVCGTMDDFYRELSKCDLSGLPVISKDLADTWIHGVGAYPKEVAQVRSTRRQMEGLQALWLGKWLDGAQEHENAEEALLEQYYEEISLFEEHTWGADVKTWMGPERVYEKHAFLEAKKSDSYRFMEQSWEEQRQRARQSEACLQSLGDLLEPGRDLKTDTGETGKVKGCQSSAEEASFYLFCGSGQPYTGWVKLPDGWENDRILVDGQEAVCAKIGEDRCCYVENLPGFTSVPIKRVPSDAVNMEGESAVRLGKDLQTAAGSCKLMVEETADCLTVENHRYRLEFSARTGAVTALWDKELQCSLLKGDALNSIFTYQYDKYGYDDINEYLRQYGYHFTTWGIQDYGRENYPVCDHETFLPVFTHYELEESTVRLFYSNRINQSMDQKEADSGKLTLGKSADQYGDALEAELEITLPPAGEELFLTLSLKDKQESPFVESGSFRILLGEQDVSWRMQKGGALLDPRKDIQDGANHSLYCLENGMAALGEEVGICFKTLDAPLVSLGKTGIYHFAPRYEQQEQASIYVNLFNNMWGTNFPQWTGGNLHFSFSLSGMKRDGESGLAQRLNCTPDMVRVTKNHFGKLGVALPRQMRLIGADPAEKGMLLQLAELSGEASPRCLAVKGCRITPVDLYGRAQGESAEERYEFDAAAFGVQSFLIEKL